VAASRSEESEVGMTGIEQASDSANTAETRMRMRYGVAETAHWWTLSRGPRRDRICTQLRELDTRIIGVSLFEKGAPDPLSDWETFASCMQAVLDAGATPMITFASFRRPYDDPRAVRWFANQCADVVWSCIEHWGGERVCKWSWCVWNEPNITWGGRDLRFEQYKRIYEEVAHGALRWLGPYLGGRKPLIGGPAVNGFLPFWLDWMWEFVNEIDNGLIGFVNWHRFGDWRGLGEWVAPADDASYRALLMSHTPDYESSAQAIGQFLRDREIENICGSLNAHTHHEQRVSGRLNQTLFGAAFYTSALLHLMRGGADGELFWTGMDPTGRYGMLDEHTNPAPVFHAKRLCARYVRYGDWISFPAMEEDRAEVDAVVARGDDGQRSALVVHQSDTVATFPAAILGTGVDECRTLLKIDRGTENRIKAADCAGEIRFDGYGVAVLTNAVAPDGARCTARP
jgi:hypothetical protein